MAKHEFRFCLTQIEKILNEYDEANRRRVWAFSKRFNERIVIMDMLADAIERSLSYARKNGTEYKAATRNLENVKRLRDDYVTIAKLGPYRRGEKRPRMVENNNRWFELVASLKAFVNTYSR